MAWTASTALVVLSLTAGKVRVGLSLDTPVLKAEGRVTFVDGLLASSVTVGPAFNALVGGCWGDPPRGIRDPL